MESDERLYDSHRNHHSQHSAVRGTFSEFVLGHVWIICRGLAGSSSFLHLKATVSSELTGDIDVTPKRSDELGVTAQI
jgi:hypothetical protein